jgi:hypothetical protein
MVPRNEGKVDMSLIPYRAAVGFLLYLSSTTRPYIAYGVGQVSKFCENPQPAHWNAVKRIFAYLKGTLDFGIWLGGRKDEGAVVYTDADYASDVDDRKSIRMHRFLQGRASRMVVQETRMCFYLNYRVGICVLIR